MRRVRFRSMKSLAVLEKCHEMGFRQISVAALTDGGMCDSE